VPTAKARSETPRDKLEQNVNLEQPRNETIETLLIPLEVHQLFKKVENTHGTTPGTGFTGLPQTFLPFANQHLAEFKLSAF
jgi:hypothetical protein